VVVSTGTTSGGGGEGGSGGIVFNAETTGEGSGGDHPTTATAAQDPTTCEAANCDGQIGGNGDDCSNTLKISCALDAHGNERCVCTYHEVFSGICFEQDASLLCSFEAGCCAGYFSGR